MCRCYPRKLTTKQVRDLVKPRVEKIDRARVEAARQALETKAQTIGATAPISLETPEDKEANARLIGDIAEFIPPKSRSVSLKRY